MVNLVIVMIVCWNVNFSRHALIFPRSWCKCECEETPEGTVFLHFTTLILLLCVTFFFFHLWLQVCLNAGVRSHTPEEVTVCDWSEPGLSPLCSLPTVTLPVVTAGFSHWSSSSVTPLSSGLVYRRSFRFSASRGHYAFLCGDIL